MLWQPQKVLDIGSEAVGAGNGVVATFDSLPQLAAEAKGSGGAKGAGRKGGGRWPAGADVGRVNGARASAWEAKLLL